MVEEEEEGGEGCEVGVVVFLVGCLCNYGFDEGFSCEVEFGEGGYGRGLVFWMIGFEFLG